MKENFCLRAGVVKDECGLVSAHPIQNGRDSIGRAPTSPRRCLGGLKHSDIRVGPRVCYKDVARVRVTGQQSSDGTGRVFLQTSRYLSILVLKPTIPWALLYAAIPILKKLPICFTILPLLLVTMILTNLPAMQ